MNTKQNILKKIQSGEIDMKPRWHFVLKSLLLILGVVLAALLVVYVLSFIFFALRQSGVGLVPSYGFRGVSIFVMNSPWLLIASAGALVVVLQLLVHKYSFSYRQPLLYTMIGVVAAVLLGSYIIGQTQFHPRMQEFSKGRNVPVVGPMYRGIDERRPENIIFGTITQVNADGFVLLSDAGESLIVLITSETKLPPATRLTVNEQVMVFGDRVAGEVTAIGVRPIPDNFDMQQPRIKPMDTGVQNKMRPVAPLEE